MDYGNLSKALFSVNHPYPEIALARAKLESKQDGYGLTKIPERVLERFSSFPKEQWDAINDSAQVEAFVLAEVDLKAIQEIGVNQSIQQHHVESTETDHEYISNLKSTRRRKYLSTQQSEYYDVDAQFDGVLELVDEVYDKHGIELDQTDHIRLRNKIVAFMKQDR